ncbi:MAG: hypothetical protein KA371_03555 [Acidobacteria bacterium]|nr:hypothetical protein [Acidobacteriota bacterium]
MTTRDTAPLDEQQVYAPMPTRTTRWLRTFLPWQLVRFAVINIRMLRLIWRGHHQ